MKSLQSIVVLVVDDDRADQKLARITLTSLEKDITCCIAGSAEEALHYVEEYKNKDAKDRSPHLILLDLHMPGMGGKAFLKRIKTGDEPCDTPVFVLTTSDSETDRQECYELGAAGYMLKPPDPQELGQVVAKAVNYWLTRPEIAHAGVSGSDSLGSRGDQ